MKYEAPDFIKVVANIKNSFAGSPPQKCEKAVGFLHNEGQEYGHTGYHCGDTHVWTDTPLAPNCWVGNVE